MKGELAVDVACMSVRPKEIEKTTSPGHELLRPYWRLGETEDAPNALGEARPTLLLVRELFASERGQRIKPRLTILLRRSPFGTNPAFLLHAVESGIER